MKISFLLLLALLPLNGEAACKILSLDEFAKVLTPEVKQIVFFASWCKGCEAHLTPEFGKNSIFVATSDDRSKAERVLQSRFGKEADSITCVFDEDESLAKKYGAKFLPYVKVL